MKIVKIERGDAERPLRGAKRIKNMKIVEIVFETSNFDRSLTMPMKHEMLLKANK